MTCISWALHSCLGEQPEGDKFTNTQQLKDIKDKGFKIIKTPYNDFGSTEKFYYATVRKSDTGREKLILLNQEFKELKNIELNSSQSRFKIFDSFVILVEDNDSSKTLTRLYFPSFQEAEIYRNESAQIILDSLRQSTPDSILKSFSPRKNSHMVVFDSVYCHCMHQKLSINLKAVYEINYPTGGKYFLLDYNDGKSTFYKDNRSYYRQSCWDGWQVEEPEEEMLRINPFDKAFTEWTKNNAIGGMQKSGYQYFKIQMSSQELQFKKYLGQYFSPHPQFFELYSSSRRDSIILKERHLGTINTIYWIIET